MNWARRSIALSFVALVACGDDAPAAPGERPTAVLVAPDRAEPNTLVRLDGRLSSDPDDGIVEFTFDFGDGSPRQVSADGFATHTYAGDGTFVVTLAVLDEAGNKGGTEHTLIVGTGVNSGSGEGSGDGSGTGTGSGSGSSDDDGSGTSSGSGEGSAEGSGQGTNPGQDTP